LQDTPPLLDKKLPVVGAIFSKYRCNLTLFYKIQRKTYGITKKNINETSTNSSWNQRGWVNYSYGQTEQIKKERIAGRMEE